MMLMVANSISYSSIILVMCQIIQLDYWSKLSGLNIEIDFWEKKFGGKKQQVAYMIQMYTSGNSLVLSAHVLYVRFVSFDTPSRW